ncbi:MAG: 5-formyltetrahydrofolate cyclo-ligase [Pseudomonadota bacterium]
MEKADLRRSALKNRDALDPDWRAQQSDKFSQFAASINFSEGAVISGFLPIRSEIDLVPLMRVLHQRGASLCLPVVLDRETIVFRRYAPGMPLVDTGFGTRGPGPNAEAVDPDIMLVPLAAFDARGNRLGYGAGHYDRAIVRLHRANRKPQLIGCAFSCQRVAAIAVEPHDVPLDAVLTEDGLQLFRDPF